MVVVVAYTLCFVLSASVVEGMHSYVAYLGGAVLDEILEGKAPIHGERRHSPMHSVFLTMTSEKVLTRSHASQVIICRPVVSVE